MARTWASVNVPLSEVPRWPEVPNDDGAGGRAAVRGVAVRRGRRACAASGRVPAEGLTRRTFPLLTGRGVPQRIGCAHAAAHQPRRAVPRARELAPDGPRRQPRDARRRRPRPSGDVRLRARSRGCSTSARRSCRRCAGGWPRCRSGSTIPYWVEEAEIDLGYHVREMALASPGTDEQLADQVARIMSRPLDRARPLWELYVIEGHESGLVAVLTKIHHAVIDGLSGAEIMALLLDLTPEGREVPPPAGRRPRRPAADRRCRCSRSGCSASPATRCGCCARCRRRSRTSRTRRSASSPARARSRRSAGVLSRDGVERPDLIAPKTIFNGRVSPHRRFVFGQLAARATSRRPRTRTARRSTTSSSRSAPARCGAG